MTNFVSTLVKEGKLVIDMEDDVLVGAPRGMTSMSREWAVCCYARMAQYTPSNLGYRGPLMSLTLSALVASITVFVLAIFLGFELISKVPPTLHTPLMSGANAISGITIVGALILSNTEFNGTGLSAWIAFVALIMATINVVGGFMVTNRMLEMMR